MTIQVGEKAPDFTLTKADGTPFQLRSALAQNAVVLYFYPKDNTAGCTAEACSFRDAYQDFKDAGAEVVGVSSDSAESHAEFATQHRLPFTLLADSAGKVRKLYGVPKTLGLLPGRMTFVIDKTGTVVHAFNSQLNATRHVTEALQSLKR
jgi:peroxiredoxin Q/BCP